MPGVTVTRIANLAKYGGNRQRSKKSGSLLRAAALTFGDAKKTSFTNPDLDVYPNAKSRNRRCGATITDL
jgi:hypothetical protein